MEENIVTSIRINKEVLHEAKQKALDLDMSVGKFIETAVIHEIWRTKKVSK